MKTIPADSTVGLEVVRVIEEGDTKRLQTLLNENKTLARSCVLSSEDDVCRSLLHIATDWPGHFLNVSETINILVSSGADVNVGIKGPDTETPLHWAASSNDVLAVDALLDAGANLNAQGAIIAGGDPLEDAIAFQNWDAAKRLVERGAKTALGDEAALGLIDLIKARFNENAIPSPENLNYSFWNACCAGQLATAKFLLDKEADINWIPEWCEESSLDGAIKSENQELVQWLKSLGAKTNAA